MNLKEPSAEEIKKAFPNGICPLMSGTPVNATSVVTPGGQGTVIPFLVQCVGERCQFWCGDTERCAAATIAIQLHKLDALKNLEPPKDGGIVGRLAEIVTALRDRRKK